MSAMIKYTLRYMPLLILGLLLIPLHVYMAGNVQQLSGVTPDQSASPYRPGSALYGVTMLPSGDAWAVGGTFDVKPGAQDSTRGGPFASRGIILHYSVNGWAAANVADFLLWPLLSVSLDSPQDGWAVGWAGTLVHYNGKIWSTIPGPANFNKDLLGVAMLSPADGWAIGYSGSILHYNGKRWTQVPGPTSVDLRSIAMPSPQEGWAVGDSGTILHYHNGTWSVLSNSPTKNILNSVSMLSSSEGWAVGRQGTILHYRDGTWESVHPASYYRNPSVYQSVDLFGVAMSSIRSGWISGEGRFLIYSSEAWIEENTVIDTLKQLELTLNQLSLYSIALSPSGGGWAVGNTNSYDSTAKNSNPGQLVILHYQGGKWYVSLIAA